MYAHIWLIYINTFKNITYVKKYASCLFANNGKKARNCHTFTIVVNQ